MNDRFKFRIWDKKLKKLAEWGNNPYHNMEIMNYICVENPVTNWEHEDYILMQSTGLKDRNGKLIYEGDIVTFLHSEEYKGVIKYNQDSVSFWLDGKGIAYNALNTIRHDYLIKLGNIYTTPELLEGKE